MCKRGRFCQDGERSGLRRAGTRSGLRRAHIWTDDQRDHTRIELLDFIKIEFSSLE